MSEYYADITLTNEIEEWLLLQGAKVFERNGLPEFKNGKCIKDLSVDVYFSGRKIHFYSGSYNSEVRIFFNDETKSTFSILLMKWPAAVFKHNFPVE